MSPWAYIKIVAGALMGLVAAYFLLGKHAQARARAARAQDTAQRLRARDDATRGELAAAAVHERKAADAAQEAAAIKARAERHVDAIRKVAPERAEDLARELRDAF